MTKIKQRRIELNLTQEDVSRKTNINLRNYQRIEKEMTCNVTNAIKIAKVLNTSVEILFT